MSNLEHPIIIKINDKGYIDDDIIVNECTNCGTPIYEDQKVVEFHDDLFCTKECLLEAFDESPFDFGASNTVA